ncbi:thyrotropin-releasing hormone receptor-like [Lineus longissimus]|uniref:thyrotropin-releasing hormone receptor-like n=1 Tax=Lineus longissimus TaxID=88925 RepID=UPI00315D296B
MPEPNLYTPAIDPWNVNGTTPPTDDRASYWEYRLDIVIWKYFAPILLFCGTIFNFTTIAVLTKTKFGKQSTRILLISLSVCDTAVLYTGLLRHWIRSFGTDVRTLTNASCPVHTFLVYFSLDFSTWILTLVTLERFVAVCYPFKSPTICTAKWTLVSLFCVAVFLFVLNGHILYYYRIKDGKCTPAAVKEYGEFWSGPWYWMDLFAVAGFPFTVILTCNTLIIGKVSCAKIHKRRSQVHPIGVNSVKNPQAAKVTSMTIMLLTINISFVVLVFPSCIFFIVTPQKAADTHQEVQIDLAFSMTNFLMYVNNTINFLLYCVSAPKFRKELTGLFRKQRRPDLDNSVTFDPRQGHSRTQVSVINLPTVDIH